MNRTVFATIRRFSALEIFTPSRFNSSSLLGVQPVRNYKSEFNLEWIPPPKFPCTDPSKSGDRSALPSADLSRPILKFQNLEELENSSHEVRKLLSLEFAPHKKTVQVLKNDTLRQVQRHQLDCSSIESQVACLTIRIRNLQKHNAEKRHDVSNRHRLKEMIDRRKSLLKHLRRMDYKRFEWLLEKLDLVYHANVQPIEKVTRKGSLQKLTTYYCNSIREKCLEAYRHELESQKEAFTKEKEELLRWIEQEEKDLGVRS